MIKKNHFTLYGFCYTNNCKEDIQIKRKEVIKMSRFVSDEVMEVMSSYMVDEVREYLHSELSPCDNLYFIAKYCELRPEFLMFLEGDFPTIATYVRETNTHAIVENKEEKVKLHYNAFLLPYAVFTSADDKVYIRRCEIVDMEKKLCKFRFKKEVLIRKFYR